MRLDNAQFFHKEYYMNALVIVVSEALRQVIMELFGYVVTYGKDIEIAYGWDKFARYFIHIKEDGRLVVDIDSMTTNPQLTRDNFIEFLTAISDQESMVSVCCDAVIDIHGVPDWSGYNSRLIKREMAAAKRASTLLQGKSPKKPVNPRFKSKLPKVGFVRGLNHSDFTEPSQYPVICRKDALTLPKLTRDQARWIECATLLAWYGDIESQLSGAMTWFGPEAIETLVAHKDMILKMAKQIQGMKLSQGQLRYIKFTACCCAH